MGWGCGSGVGKLCAIEAHEQLEGVAQHGDFALDDEVVSAGFEG